MNYIAKLKGETLAWEIYYFAVDSNKILVVTTAILLFVLFKKYKNKYIGVINEISLTTFGVLLIHAIVKQCMF